MKEKMYIGIDLGTTYSSIAYLDESHRPVIEKNLEGEEETPSAIFFDPNGEIVVGSEAKGKTKIYPDYTVTQIKRHIGQDKKYTYHEVQYTPVQLSAMILRKLTNDFRKTRGVEVTEAVVTVPAQFGDAAREATVAAARFAGIKNVTVLDEPVAAAIAYGYGNMNGGHKRVLVFDFGGGTLDISILDIDGNQLRAVATGGNTGLGGVDFDTEVTKLIINKVATETGLDPGILESDVYFLSDLEIMSERIKIRLSSSDVASDTISLDNGSRVRFDVTRQEFENATRPMINEAVDLIDSVLKDAHCSMDEIDSVVLVGGSSKMPMVPAAIAERFPYVNIETYETLHAVACGAAIFAGRELKSGPEITNVLSKTFGVMTGNDVDGYVVTNVIFRNHRLPDSSFGRFRPQEDGQLKSIIKIYENNAIDDEKHTAVEDSVYVGEFPLDLPEAVSVETPIVVQFNVSDEAILTATAECGDRRETYVLKTPVSVTAEQIKAADELMDRVRNEPRTEE